MEAIVTIIVLAIIGSIIWKVAVRAKNFGQNVASVGRQVSTRVRDSVICKSCGAAIPTVFQFECARCGFTKSRNIASACPNCGVKAGFAPCPECGDSIKFG